MQRSVGAVGFVLSEDQVSVEYRARKLVLSGKERVRNNLLGFASC